MGAEHTTRVSHTRVADVVAVCLGCRWASSARNAHGNAARHHDATGHPVRVSVTRITTYGDPTAGAPGQESRMGQIDGAGRGTVAA